MWTALFPRRLPRPSVVPDLGEDDLPPDNDVPSGWHESSWALAAGVEVSELPASEAAAWFADA